MGGSFRVRVRVRVRGMGMGMGVGRFRLGPGTRVDPSNQRALRVDSQIC